MDHFCILGMLEFAMGMLGFVMEIISVEIEAFLHTGNAWAFHTISTEIGAYLFTVNAWILFITILVQSVAFLHTVDA